MGRLALACLLSGRLWVHAHTNLAGAYAEIGFDPSFPGNVPVVFISDVHMNLMADPSSGIVLTTNLNPQLLGVVNAMNPPPAKIIFGGDASTSLSQVPGHAFFDEPVIVAYATNEMALFLSALASFTNVAFTNIVWVPGQARPGPL